MAVQVVQHELFSGKFPANREFCREFTPPSTVRPRECAIPLAFWAMLLRNGRARNRELENPKQGIQLPKTGINLARL